MSEEVVVQGSVVEAGTAAPAEDDAGNEASDEALLEDLLVEEVSIDGMCGVY